MKKLALAIAALMVAVSPNLLNADVVYFEDFEDGTLASPGYVVTPVDDLASVAAENYWGRIDRNSADWIANDYNYTDHQGDGFYGASDTDSANSGNIDLVTLSISAIDISTFTNLDFSFLVAEDDDGTNQDWDVTTSFRISTQVDGGGFVQMFGIEGASDTIGNQAPRVDTNFDGIGDGVEITDEFTEFSFSIADGTTLDILIEIEDLDTGDEDIAFDNLLLQGDFMAIPEPTAFSILAAMGLGVCLRRRRR